VEKISALIPYKPDHGRRDFLWGFVRQRYEQLLPQIELCLGNDDGELFCRAKAINEAARKATGDIFMIVDTDLVYNPQLVEELLTIVHDYPWVIPFSNAYRLTREATDHLLQLALPETIKADQAAIESKQVIIGA
jgi:hypothetical protein